MPATPSSLSWASKALVALIYAIACMTSSSAQITFVRHYGGSSGQGFSLIQNSNSEYIVAGNKNHMADPGEACMYAFNEYGDTLWLNHYGTDSLDQVNQVVETTDGGYVAVGQTRDLFGTYSKIMVIKTTSTGALSWQRSMGGQGEEQAIGVDELASGELVICGRTTLNGNGAFDMLLIKTESDGDTLWTRRYGGTENEEANSIRRTQDGGLVMAGYTASFPVGSKNCYIVRTNEVGDTLWTRSYGGSDDDYLHTIRTLSDGGMIAAGVSESYGVSTENAYVIRTDASGDTLWTRTYGQAGRWSWAYDVVGTTDGGFAIAGLIRTASPNGGNDVYLVKTDALGMVQWEREFKIEPSNLSYTSSVGHSLLQNTDGGFTVAGRWFNASSYEVLLIRTDANGIVGIEEQNIENFGFVHPNPFSDRTTVQLGYSGRDRVTLNIYSMDGHLVRTVPNIRSATVEVDRGSMRSGVYQFVLSSPISWRSCRVVLQ